MRHSRPGFVILIGVLLLSFSTDVEGRWRRRRRITGELELVSSTTGARVYIDGAEVGSIPMGRNIRLRPGQHVVKVVKPGYTQFMESVKIRRGKTTRLEVDLFPVGAEVAFLTNIAGARVYIDGKFIGRTPLKSVAVNPGKHKVRIAKLGYYDVIKKLTVTAGKALRVRATLKSLPDEINPLIPKEPPKRWYEKWWVWVSAAGGLVALATAIAVPVAISMVDKVDRFGPDRTFHIP